MKYKFGDEVLVKAKIASELNKYGCDYILAELKKGSFLLQEDDIVQDTDMTAEEAWEIAKKLFADYSDAELDEIFGKGWSFPKLMELTPQQAKAKIEEWETAKEIKVGDEVALKSDPCNNDYKFFVTYIDKIKGRIGGWSGFDGGVFAEREIKRYKKTGRRIEIDGLLQKIGGDE